MTFYQFLLANNVSISLFIKNCTEPYRDPEDDLKYSETIHNHHELFAKVIPTDWVDTAFIWKYALQYDEYFWSELYFKWRHTISSNKELKIETVHGFPNPTVLSSRKG